MALVMALWGILAFLAVEVCVFLPLYIVGIPMAWCASRWVPMVPGPSRIFPERQILAYRWRWIDWWVGNYEDGAAPEGWTAFRWFLRNPVCNLRFTPIISTVPGPDTRRVGSVDEIPPDGAPGWFLAWRGPYVGFRWQCRTWGVWLGWKVNPRDARFIAPDDYRRWGLGTACQVMRFGPQSDTVQPPSRLSP